MNLLLVGLVKELLVPDVHVGLSGRKGLLCFQGILPREVDIVQDARSTSEFEVVVVELQTSPECTWCFLLYFCYTIKIRLN